MKKQSTKTKNKIAKKVVALSEYQKRKAAAKPVPFVLKDKFLQVTIGDKSFTLDSTHPTFERMKKALLEGNWVYVPKLISIAKQLVSETKGNVNVEKGVVYYKGTAVDSRLTKRILEMMNHGKEVKHMLLFMDDLYKNPEPLAIKEFFGWLENNNLPITDDGCFIGYKSVDENLKDEHTHTIDNSPGQVIMMPRAAANLNYREQCSYGFHVCSKAYGLYGSRVMAVKVRPQDVIAAPEGGKMRVLRYEVLKELGSISEDLFKLNGFSSVENLLVMEIKRERKELIQLLLKSPAVKSLIRRKKISKETIQRANYARLNVMAKKYDALPAEAKQENQNTTESPLKAARKAAGLSIGQLAEAMNKDYKFIAGQETMQQPPSGVMDYYLTIIAKLVGIRNLSRSAISYPKAVRTI